MPNKTDNQPYKAVKTRNEIQDEDDLDFIWKTYTKFIIYLIYF